MRRQFFNDYSRLIIILPIPSITYYTGRKNASYGKG